MSTEVYQGAKNPVVKRPVATTQAQRKTAVRPGPRKEFPRRLAGSRSKNLSALVSLDAYSLGRNGQREQYTRLTAGSPSPIVPPSVTGAAPHCSLLTCPPSTTTSPLGSPAHRCPGRSRFHVGCIPCHGHRHIRLHTSTTPCMPF
jgi:hypothetical protein